MKCKTLARHASDLQEKGHFSCKNLALARSMQVVQVTCKFLARFVCNACKIHLAGHFPCKNLASIDLQDFQIIFPWVGRISVRITKLYSLDVRW